MSESGLIYEVMQELGKHGAVFRTNAGTIKLPNGRIFHGLPKGFSDIMLIRPDGVACFIETKVRPNTPTPEQLKFIEKMNALHARAGIAYSVDEALHICGLSIQ